MELTQYSSVERLNNLLRRVPLGNNSPVACLLTGSSGCGKTFLGEALRDRLDPSHVSVMFPDKTEGVPPVADMIEECGTIERWQEQRTHSLIARIAETRDRSLVILDSQFHPRFAVEGCSQAKLNDYLLAVVTCEERIWKQRLHGPRKQPEIINADMINWWRLLRDETPKHGGIIIDTSDSNLDKNMSELISAISPLLEKRIRTG